MTEHEVQDQIRVALMRLGHLVFRINVGEGWTGESVRLQNGAVLIRKPRRFTSGAPKGWPDLMVITTDGILVFIEVKSATGRVRKEQSAFMSTMRTRGVTAGIARNVDDAMRLIAEATTKKRKGTDQT